MIKKVGNKYCVFTSDGSRKLGCHPTKIQAVGQLQAIEASKRRKVSGTKKVNKPKGDMK